MRKLWRLLTDDSIKPVRSRAELVRTVAAVVAMFCTIGSFVILVAVHVL